MRAPTGLSFGPWFDVELTEDGCLYSPNNEQAIWVSST